MLGQISLLVVDHVGQVSVARLTQRLRLTGEVARTVGEQLSSLAETPGRRLVINLANVDVLTSLMLSRFMALDRQLTAAGGRLVLCEPTPTIREILDLVHLSWQICVYETEGEALSSFAAQPANNSCAQSFAPANSAVQRAG